MIASTAIKANDIGAETSSEGPTPVPPAPSEKSSDQKLQNWLIGFGFSWLPVLSYPVVVLLRTGEFLQFLSLVFTDASVIYIGVSLTVSAMNDLGPKESTRAKLYTLFLAFAAMVYSGINLTQKLLTQEKVNAVVLIVMNLAFLAVPLVCGFHQYLRKDGGNNDE